MSRHGATHEEDPAGSVLDALLLAERDAEARLEQARAAAVAVLSRAIAEATERERVAVDDLAAELAALDAEHARTLAQMERSVTDVAATVVAQLRGLDDQTIQRLAAVVLADVSGLPASSAP